MGELEFQVSLRFQGDELVPNEVTQLIGCLPTQCHTKGEEIRSKHFVRTAPTGVWLLQYGESKSLDDAVNGLFDLVTCDREVLHNLTRAFKAEILVGIFTNDVQAGTVMSEYTVGRIAAAGLAVSLDIYWTGCPSQ